MKTNIIAACTLASVVLLGPALANGQYGGRRPVRVAQSPSSSGGSILRSLFQLNQRADEQERAIEEAIGDADDDLEPAANDAIENALQNAVVRERQRPPVDTTRPVRIPIRNPDVNVTTENGLVSIVVRDASLKDVVAMIGETLRLNVVCADTVSGTLSISLERVPLEQALTAITSASGSTWTVHEGIIYVTELTANSGLAPEVQGRVFRVFELDYVVASDVSTIVAGLLSPVGQSFTVVSASDDNRKAREAIVVEDVASSVERIADRIAQLDVAPRQVQIEAHVLEVELSDDMRHGVNFQEAFNMSGHTFRLSTNGFAMPTATQAFFAEISGPDMSGLIEWLQTTSDAKTLASPSITVLNKQAASIQIGEQLGFRVTTTTDTSTTEGVETLDVGVLLEVTPQISRDNRVLLRVRPEISSGQVNPNTGLPEEEVTELQTDVLLEDGKGIVIGGLIQEKDELNQSKVPWFGDIDYLGKFFGLQDESRKRAEIIIALIPRIVPLDPERQAMDDWRYHRATTPLLHGPLLRQDRPWEPRLPDPTYNPTPYSPIWGPGPCACGGNGQCDSCQQGAKVEAKPGPQQPAVHWRGEAAIAPQQQIAPPAHQAPPPAAPVSSRRQMNGRPPPPPPPRNASNWSRHFSSIHGRPAGRGPVLQRFPPLGPEQSAQPAMIGRRTGPSIRQ